MADYTPLRGTRALVGGASRGIGRATAEMLASQGASVVAMARSRDALDELVRSLPASGDGKPHVALAVDASDLDALATAIGGEIDANGPITVFVHNTGGPPGGPIIEAATDAFESAMRQHLLAGHRVVQTLLPGMKQAGGGRVICVTSTSVYEPIPGLGVSNTTRWAVAAWAKTLSREVAPYGVTVNNVLPGYTATDRLDSLIEKRAEREGKSPEEVRAAWLGTVPMGRFAKPEETAAAIAFLAGPSAAYITGVTLPVDGGRLGST